MFSFVTDSPINLMIEYFELFGDKFCCHEDLTVFTELLNEEEEKQVRKQTNVTFQGNSVMRSHETSGQLIHFY